MDLLIGDSAIDVPIQWALGTVAISHQAGDDSSQSSLTAINALFQPKPEIVHLQRIPGRRPPSAVSVLFTALALAPLGLLFYMLSSVGANLKVSNPSELQSGHVPRHSPCHTAELHPVLPIVVVSIAA